MINKHPPYKVKRLSLLRPVACSIQTVLGQDNGVIIILITATSLGVSMCATSKTNIFGIHTWVVTAAHVWMCVCVYCTVNANSKFQSLDWTTSRNVWASVTWCARNCIFFSFFLHLLWVPESGRAKRTYGDIEKQNKNNWSPYKTFTNMDEIW